MIIDKSTAQELGSKFDIFKFQWLKVSRNFIMINIMIVTYNNLTTREPHRTKLKFNKYP